MKPKKERDGPYERPSGDLGPSEDGVVNLPFPVGPSNPANIVPIAPTPKAIVRRHRPGPYEQPAEEEETLVPHDGTMELSTFFGPQPTAIEEDRTMRSDFAPKRPSETPLAATSSKKPASGPPSWPPPPTRPTAEDETLVPRDGTLTVQYPTASSSSSSSSSGPPPPRKPKKNAPPPAVEEEEALVPLDGVMELPYPIAPSSSSSSSPPPKPKKVAFAPPAEEETLTPLDGTMQLRRLRQVNLSVGNQKVW